MTSQLNHDEPTIMVLGDIFLDHSLYGEVHKIANESPTPVLQASKESYTLGGAGNVMMNLRALGANVISMCPIGQNDAGKTVRKLIYQYGIQDFGIESPTYKTPIKHRGFAGKKHLFRYDVEEVHNHHETVYRETLGLMECLIKHNTIKAIVCSDYNKGLFTDDFASAVIQMANKYNIPTIVDPKGNFSKYAGCTFLKPNYSEAQKATHVHGLTANFEALRLLVKPTYTCITMAEKGLYICENKNGHITHAPTQKIDVIDVTGAGDIVTAVVAYCFSNQATVDFMAKSAAFLATQSVQHVGTYVIQQDDLWELYRQSNPFKIISEIQHLPTLPRHKKRIVFTNGCFDMFHAGHLESLKYAKKLGDILIVGVNSDASIQALKGPNRPIIPLEQRVQILEALECVDYIVPFDTITPEHLLEMIRPHIYVKGAEYAGHEFSAAKYVDMIHLNPMITGVSTTKIIQKICDTHIQKPVKHPQEVTNAANLAAYNAIKDIWKK
jgi:D-beta-D-heptose 7-phosphate kinase/D-beta-D-heptose 1-phosphate adenosyltransferase